MTERPILFSGPMVRAILDGAKTQMRRPLPPVFNSPPGLISEVIPPTQARGGFFDSLFHKPGSWGLRFGNQPACSVRCPFGAPGDRLWVRETWRPVASGTWPREGEDITVTYAADGAKSSVPAHITESWAWPYAATLGNLPSIHMPRWASRITLEVLDVRVQRLQDISEEDARAEGIEAAPNGRWFGASRAMRGRVFKGIDMAITYPTAREAFADLWSATYGAESWAANPWTWAITFRRVED